VAPPVDEPADRDEDEQQCAEQEPEPADPAKYVLLVLLRVLPNDRRDDEENYIDGEYGQPGTPPVDHFYPPCEGGPSTRRLHHRYTGGRACAG
jgi:hypothetical protein